MFLLTHIDEGTFCYRGFFMPHGEALRAGGCNRTPLVYVCCLLWYFDYKQGRELRLSVCFNTIRNFNRSLNKRRMSPAQTITTEWTAEICLDKRQTNRQTQLGNRANRWSQCKCRQTLAVQVEKSSLIAIQIVTHQNTHINVHAPKIKVTKLHRI